MKELKELLKLYKISRINHSVVHNILIEYDKKEFDKYEIDLEYNKLNDEYYIFIIIEKSNKLIFKGLYKHDLKVLDNTYNELKENLYSLNFEDFIKKYYLELKNHFWKIIINNG